MSILTEIAARTRERIEEEKFKVPTRVLMSQLDSELAKHAMEKQSFLDALRKGNVLYLRGEKGVPLQRADRAGFSLSEYCKRV